MASATADGAQYTEDDAAFAIKAHSCQQCAVTQHDRQRSDGNCERQPSPIKGQRAAIVDAIYD